MQQRSWLSFQAEPTSEPAHPQRIWAPLEAVYELRLLGPRADEAHVATQDTP
jgi:hypothetical protein